MQKFTIFTIIFSTIVLTVVAELVLQDYLQELYPAEASLQANITTQDDFEFFYPDKEEDTTVISPEEKTDTVLRILEEGREDDTTHESAGISDSEENLENTDTEEDVEATEDLNLGAPVSTRVKTLLPALDIEGVKYQAGTPSEKLWEIVKIDDLAIKEKVLGYFEVQDIIGSFYEFETKNPLVAESVYDELKIRLEQSPEIEINETDQYGQASYYVNHSVKVGEVFVVIRRDNYIYCFAYKKDYHEIFKAFFAVLL